MRESNCTSSLFYLSEALSKAATDAVLMGEQDHDRSVTKKVDMGEWHLKLSKSTRIEAKYMNDSLKWSLDAGDEVTIPELASKFRNWTEKDGTIDIKKFIIFEKFCKSFP